MLLHRSRLFSSTCLRRDVFFSLGDHLSVPLFVVTLTLEDAICDVVKEPDRAISSFSFDSVQFRLEVSHTFVYPHGRFASEASKLGSVEATLYCCSRSRILEWKETDKVDGMCGTSRWGLETGGSAGYESLRTTRWCRCASRRLSFPAATSRGKRSRL